MAKLSGSVAVIRIGDTTEIEKNVENLKKRAILKKNRVQRNERD